MSILKEFDCLRKHIKSEEGKKIAKEFRKKLKRSDNYSTKLDSYFCLTLDGVKAEEAKNELGL